MCALYEYNIVRSTGKLRFARGTRESRIYQGHPLLSVVIKNYFEQVFTLTTDRVNLCWNSFIIISSS
jgi:hypothetical protein